MPGSLLAEDVVPRLRGRLGRPYRFVESCPSTQRLLGDDDPEVKFPNDVFLGGRKVAGILAEASEGRVVLGVGVNVTQKPGELPADARTPATSLAIETGRAIDRAELLVALLERLERRYDEWLR